MESDGTICRACGGQGFIFESRQTVYRANIRATNEPLANPGDWAETNVAGRKFENFVRTKMVAVAYDHIEESIGATIDGKEYELLREPRYSSYVNNHYVISWWKRVNR